MTKILNPKRKAPRTKNSAGESLLGVAAMANNKLPSGWQWKTVSALGVDGEQVVLTGPFGSTLGREDFIESGVPLLTIGCLTERGIVLDKAFYVSKQKAEQLQRYRVSAGDLLFSRSASVGRAGVVTDAFSGSIINYHLMRLRLDENRILPRLFVAYVQGSGVVRRYLKSVNHGATRDGINTTDLLAMPVAVPPRHEQSRILAEIEKQFTRLDAGVAALKRAQANLKRFRAAVLKAACEGKLVPTEAELAKAGKAKARFETGEQLLARILTDRRKKWQGRGKYKEPVEPNTTELGPLPEGWAWATFEQIAERVTVGFVGSMKHEYVDRGVPFLRGQNVRENRFDPEGLLYVSPEFHQKLIKSALRPGDLAVVRSGSVGVTCVIPDFLHDSNCSDLVLIQRPLGFVPQYGAYYMNSLAKRHVAAGKVGVALIHFNTKSVAALALPLPPLVEQKRIVAEVERRVSVLDELEAMVTANLQRAARLRQSILQKAFEGKLLTADGADYTDRI